MITARQNTAHIFQRFKRGAYLLLMLLLLQHVVPAQTGGPSEYQVKAAFLYNFTRFINWPGIAFSSSTAPFVIGILGGDPFGSLIDETIKGESIGSHPIVVRRFESIDEMGNCHLLYIDSDNEDHIRTAANMAARKNILTVGSDPNFIKYGGMIRFYTDKSKIRMQINNSAAKKAQISISSKLLSVAQVVSN